MEMTIPFTDFKTNNFSNRVYEPGKFCSVQMSRMLLGFLAGPGIASGALSSIPVIFPTHDESYIHAPAVNEVKDNTVPVAELINAIREGWHLNMTELAEILALSRPTLYNWLKGKPVADPEVLYRMQALVAAAKKWKEHVNQGGQDFLLDYTGPRADEESIRQAMCRSEVTADDLCALIHQRKKQYQEAYAQSREILGEPVQVKGEPIRESSRKLNKRWTENAQRIHRARNASK